MGYVLIKPEVLKEKGVENFDTMPDGRAIVDFSMLCVLGSIDQVEIVSTANEMLEKIRIQKESGVYDKKPVEEQPLVDVEDEDNAVTDGSIPQAEIIPGTETAPEKEPAPVVPEAGAEQQGIEEQKEVDNKQMKK